jgi:hypothetical protein
MNIVPIEHQAQGPSREMTFNNSQIDLDRHFVFALLGVEVRWTVVAVVHHDHDPKEPAEFWHP